MSRVPLFRLPSDSSLQAAIAASVARVINSNWFVLGAEVKTFESEFATYCGVDHCISVANGTDALELAMRALGIKSGDSVLMAANAGFYASIAARLIGAIPVYADVERESLTLCPTAVEKALVRGPLPRAIVVTHLYGRLAAIESIVRLAERFNIPVLEDCAQAHGAMRQERRAGSFGTISCFSFYPTKNLGAMGDGGAVLTNDGELGAIVRKLRQYGWGDKYSVQVAGGRNSRLDEMQAAILRTKLNYLNEWNEERRNIARRYNHAFSSLPIKYPDCGGSDHVSHLYVVQTSSRNEFRAYLDARGVASDIHYPIPDHQQPAYSDSRPGFSLPYTEEACRTAISLPCFPGMTDSEVNTVISAVQDFFSQVEGHDN